MLETTALPFVFHRHHQEYNYPEYKTTSEMVHGLVRMDIENLYLQWRLTREIKRYGVETKTDRQQSVREVTIPLEKLSGARVKRVWSRIPPREALVLTASDLQTFEAVTAEDQVPGLALSHPAELALQVRWRDRKLLHAFVGSMRVAISERMLSNLGHESRAHERLEGQHMPELSAGKNPDSGAEHAPNEKGHT